MYQQKVPTGAIIFTAGTVTDICDEDAVGTVLNFEHKDGEYHRYTVHLALKDGNSKIIKRLWSTVERWRRQALEKGFD